MSDGVPGGLGGVRARPQQATYLWALAMRVSSRPSSTVRMWMALSLDTVRSPGAGAQHGHPGIPSPSPSPPRPRALTLPIRGEGDVPAGLEVVPRGPELLGVPRQAGVAVPAGSGGQEDRGGGGGGEPGVCARPLTGTRPRPRPPPPAGPAPGAGRWRWPPPPG